MGRWCWAYMGVKLTNARWKEAIEVGLKAKSLPERDFKANSQPLMQRKAEGRIRYCKRAQSSPPPMKPMVKCIQTAQRLPGQVVRDSCCRWSLVSGQKEIQPASGLRRSDDNDMVLSFLSYSILDVH